MKRHIFIFPAIVMVLAALCFQTGCASSAGAGADKKSAGQTKSSRTAAKKAPSSEADIEKRVQALAHFATGLSDDLNEKSDDATEEYWKAAMADPSYEPLVIDLAKRLIREKKADRALALLQKATTASKASGNLYAWLAIVNSAAGKEAAAIEANRMAIKRSPNSLLAYQNLGQIYIQSGQTNQAVALLKDAAGNKDAEPEFLLGLVDIYSQYGRQQLIPDEQAKTNILQALDRAAAKKPTNPILIQKLADSYLQQAEYAKAEPFYSQLLEKYPELPGLRERLANLYLRTGDKEKASKLFESIRLSRPTDPQAYLFLGSLAYEEKDYNKAAEYYQTAIKLNPDFEPLYYDLTGILIALKKPEEALKVLEIARSKFKLNFTLEFYTGITKAILEKYNDAINHFTSAELLAKTTGETNRLNQMFYYQLGSTFERAGNIPEAEKAFKKSLELSPDYAEAMNYLGYMWAERGEHLEEAHELLTKALKLEPNNSAFMDSMAWVLYKQKKLDEALTWMEKALKASEKPDATLLDHLGDIHSALKQFDKAREAWEKSIKLESNESIKKKLQSAPK